MSDDDDVYTEVAFIAVTEISDGWGEFTANVTLDADVEWVSVTKQQFEAVQHYLSRISNDLGMRYVMLTREHVVYSRKLSTQKIIERCVDIQAQEMAAREEQRIKRLMKKKSKDAAVIAAQIKQAKQLLEQFNDDGTLKQ